jgi:phospholipase C
MGRGHRAARRCGARRGNVRVHGHEALGRAAAGIHKIKHVVVIMQENRSFDSYFGTYPGADGIPRGVCVPILAAAASGRITSDRTATSAGRTRRRTRARHRRWAMDGFVREAVAARKACRRSTRSRAARAAAGSDVMGYHDAREIPNYWAYARNFVLQDHMFEPNKSWSLPRTCYGQRWSAKCTVKGDPMSCVDAPDLPRRRRTSAATSRRRSPTTRGPTSPYLLHKHHVSWRYYVFEGTEPDCETTPAISCEPIPQNAKTPGIWNPLPGSPRFARTGSSQHHVRCATSSAPRAREAARRLVDRPTGRRSASIRRAQCRPGRRTSRRS